MCTPASFVVTVDNVYWDTTDSHSEIRRKRKLHEEQSLGIQTVSVELTPPEPFAYDAPLDQWVYQAQQDIFPLWYNAEQVEARCRRALSEWAKARLVLRGSRRDCRSGDRLVVWGGKVGNVWSGGIVDIVGNKGKVYTVHSNAIVANVLRGGYVRSVISGGRVQYVYEGGIVGDVYGVVDNVREGGVVQTVWGKAAVLTCYGTVETVRDDGVVRVIGFGSVRDVMQRGTVLSDGDVAQVNLRGRGSVMVRRGRKGIEISARGRTLA